MLGKVEGTAWDADAAAAMLSTYQGFLSVYWRCVNRVTDKLLAPKDDTDYQTQFDGVLRAEKSELVKFARMLADSRHKRMTFTAQILLAVIFAWWTVSSCKGAVDAFRSVANSAASTSGEGGGSKSSSGSSSTGIDRNYLRQPHAAQVMSVFRLLGIRDACPADYVVKGVGNDKPVAAMFNLPSAGHAGDFPAVTFANHLAEIKTGEGALTHGYLVHNHNHVWLTSAVPYVP
jgi:hypothetical protein